jgi:hypothetical protein
MALHSFARSPTASGAGLSKLLMKMFHHPCSPKWNHAACDSLTDSDLLELDQFSDRLTVAQSSDGQAVPDKQIIEWIIRKTKSSPYFSIALSKIGNLLEDCNNVVCMDREVLLSRLLEIIPKGAPRR